MKSIVKTTLALTVLLTVTGCWDFGWSKKHQENESAEAATPGQSSEHSSKCTHKGCKDKHHDEVQTQSMDEYGNVIDDENLDLNMDNDMMDQYADINMDGGMMMDENADLNMDGADYLA